MQQSRKSSVCDPDTAARGAGVGTVVAAYGYTASIEDVRNWHADLVIDRPQDLLAWIL